MSRTRRALVVVFVLATLLSPGGTLAHGLLPPVGEAGPDNADGATVALPIVYGGWQSTRRIVSCLGDSVTHGFPYVGTQNTYPARLQAIFDSVHGAASFEVINHGVSGYRADQVLADLQTLGWMDEDPDFVLLMVGGNDLAQETLIYGLAETIRRTVSEVQAIVDQVTAHVNADGSTPRVIVSAFIPNLILDYWGSGAVAQYNASLESNLTGIDLWTADNWDDFYDPDTGQADTSLMSDLVHPNVEGYSIIAENCFDAIQVLLLASTGLSSSPEAPATTATVTDFDKWSLWTGETQLRGANIYQRRVYPELDGPTFLGAGPLGPPYAQEDLDSLAALGANYVNISHPGLFTETSPYVLDQDIQDNLDNLLAMIAQADMFAVISFRTGPGRSEFTFHEVGDWFDESYLNDQVWVEQAAQDAWAAMWAHTAECYGDNPIVVGYDLMVEPNSNDVWLDAWDAEEFYATYSGTLYDWNQFFPDVTAAIREIDPDTPLLIGGMAYSAVDWLPYLQPTSDQRTVYTVHQYAPFVYTHQEPPLTKTYPGVFDTDWNGSADAFNRDWLDDLLSAVDDFETAHSVPVAVNEFGVKRWEPGAADFMADEMDLFEKRGMNYALWLWEVSWSQYAAEVDAFNFRHGPNPSNHSDVESSDLMGAITDAWAQNATRPSSVATEVQIPLVPGWNLVSIPLSPSSPGLPEALASIAGYYDLVCSYDSSSTSDPWKQYDAAAPPYSNDLTEIDETMGLWLRATAAVTLTVSGSAPSTAGISLLTGWNLVGYPSSTLRPVTEALVDIDGKYELIYAYDAADAADPWKTYDPTVLPPFNGLTDMVPGGGYWIRVSEDCVWTVR